jgi:hypothetical protein
VHAPTFPERAGAERLCTTSENASGSSLEQPLNSPVLADQEPLTCCPLAKTAQLRLTEGNDPVSKTRVRVLHADDSPAEAELLRQTLSSEPDIEHVGSVPSLRGDEARTRRRRPRLPDRRP